MTNDWTGRSVLPPERRLPSIADLVQIYGIARTTAAKALRVLIEEGLTEDSPGWDLRQPRLTAEAFKRCPDLSFAHAGGAARVPPLPCLVAAGPQLIVV